MAGRGRRARRGQYSEHSGKRFYTTDTGYRLLFDLENRIATGEQWELEDVEDSEAAHQTQQVVVDLLNMGLRSQGVSPTQWVGYSGTISGYRLSINQSMSVFNAAVSQEIISDDVHQALQDTDWGGSIEKGDEPFGPWDF